MQIRPDLNTENVLKRISSYDIFKRYCENFQKIGRPFCSTLRSDDNKASCRIDYIGNDLLYKDFGDFMKGCRAIVYVARKFNTDYYSALLIVNKDFNLGLGLDNKAIQTNVSPIKYDTTKSNKPNIETPTVIHVKYRKYHALDLLFWGQFYWTLEMLQSVDIYPISHFWLDNKRNNFRRITIPNDQLAYTMDYYTHRKVFRRKIYQPLNLKFKFVSNVDDTIVQGYKNLDKTGDILFVTSSLKDCGVFWRLGYNAVAPNSESTFLPEKFLRKYKKRYERIIIWFDNDFGKETNQGIINAKKFSEMYELEYCHTPDNTAKDPSDFVRDYGIGEFYKYLNYILHG